MFIPRKLRLLGQQRNIDAATFEGVRLTGTIITNLSSQRENAPDIYFGPV